MKFNVIYIGIFLLSIMSCSRDTGFLTPDVDEEIVQENPGNIQEIAALPLNVTYPGNNPQSAAKEELGRLLFWDPVLSGTMTVACASCHHPDFAYADGLERSPGVVGGPIDRNAPTILNTAFNGIETGNNYNPAQAPMFWDNRNRSLEDQSIQPILSAVEMRGNAIPEDEIVDVVIDRLEAIPEYVDRFAEAFGNGAITEQDIADAIATFERSLVAGNSRFDQYMRGNANILSQQELNGLDDFIDVGCADCHSGPMLSDFDLHTLSVPNNGVNDMGANGDYDFRTPSLRNIALTGPYMHNGVFDDLEEVLEFYDDISRGNGNSQNNNVNDNQIANDARNLNLNNNQIDDIVAFLETLTDRSFDTSIPASVPSNLQVPINIRN